MSSSRYYKTLRKFLKENVYLFLGIIIGLYLSSLLSLPLKSCKHNKLLNRTAQDGINLGNNISLRMYANKTLPTEKKSKLIRPRYYSTELGIREKLFVGILTSEEKINTQAVHINKTIGHLVNKIKFFITAQYKLKTKFNLTGLVGFTDARMKYRPFQIVKYVGDVFRQDYDYYFFANDYTFINAHKLKEVVDKISVSMDVYLGVKVKDSSYCNLDSGIILSNSVLKAMRIHLDWCIMNAISEDHSENIGRCIYHSLGLSCQETVQMVQMSSFKLKHFELSKHLLELKNKEEFNNAVTVYPILQQDDIYILNAYFIKERLTLLNQEIKKLSQPLTENWPAAQRPGAIPATRFDLPKQYYFNMSHIFFPDDFTNIRKHTESERLDIQNIVNEVKAKMLHMYPNDLQYRRLINGYRIFDLSRGMDYVLDLGFRDLKNGKEITKRFEVSKPLGSVEFIPTPYVTENTRVTILLPIQESEITLATSFLTTDMTRIMDRKEKTFFMIVLLYQYDSESKGPVDIFGDIKNIVTQTANKYKNEDIKIAWVSVRLPQSEKPIYVEDNESLRFSIVDLALKKVGLDSLVLYLDPHCNITVDFLNRVRMNTIANFQIFSPIPFRQYNPKISMCTVLEVNKNCGHFDRDNYKYISFNGRDYVNARKKYQHIIPLIRIDNDIINLLDNDHKNKGNIFEMFLKFSENLHCMRATEMNLRIKYYNASGSETENLFLGNEIQLAKTLLLKSNQIWEVS